LGFLLEFVDVYDSDEAGSSLSNCLPGLLFTIVDKKPLAS